MPGGSVTVRLPTDRRVWAWLWEWAWAGVGYGNGFRDRGLCPGKRASGLPGPVGGLVAEGCVEAPFAQLAFGGAAVLTQLDECEDQVACPAGLVCAVVGPGGVGLVPVGVA